MQRLGTHPERSLHWLLDPPKAPDTQYQDFLLTGHRYFTSPSAVRLPQLSGTKRHVPSPRSEVVLPSLAVGHGTQKPWWTPGRMNRIDYQTWSTSHGLVEIEFFTAIFQKRGRQRLVFSAGTRRMINSVEGSSNVPKTTRVIPRNGQTVCFFSTSLFKQFVSRYHSVSHATQLWIGPRVEPWYLRLPSLHLSPWSKEIDDGGRKLFRALGVSPSVHEEAPPGRLFFLPPRVLLSPWQTELEGVLHTSRERHRPHAIWDCHLHFWGG